MKKIAILLFCIFSFGGVKVFAQFNPFFELNSNSDEAVYSLKMVNEDLLLVLNNNQYYDTSTLCFYSRPEIFLIDLDGNIINHLKPFSYNDKIVLSQVVIQDSIIYFF